MKKEELNVLGAMMRDPVGWHYSLRIGADAGVPPGTIYPALAKLERAGWLESCWDSGKGATISRRRLYRLTGAGQQIAAEALAESSLELSASRIRRRLGFGLPKPARGVA